jgi:peptidoglycan L-alanyl-D-glutamate endopeptidase CwlK
MPHFGKRSLDNLKDVHPDLVRLAMAVIPHWDCQVVDGSRSIEEQVKNVERGVSKTMESKHLPQGDGFSHAIDIVPYPVDWPAIERGLVAIKRADPGMQVAEFYGFIGFMQGMATAMGIKTRVGADWDNDREFSDHTFVDLPHHELKED